MRNLRASTEAGVRPGHRQNGHHGHGVQRSGQRDLGEPDRIRLQRGEEPVVSSGFRGRDPHKTVPETYVERSK